MIAASTASTASTRRSFEFALAGMVVAVIALIVLPVPLYLLDTLIAVNIAASIILLMIPLYTSSSVALSTFPSLLLFTTLFRLSLNIASTKQILMHADGGHIIDTFGHLVVGGNVVVGLIVFLIIATVQFIVISKGGERVAEVGARFSLDAMPGKQMSIDADLRAGNITKDEAQRRREGLDQESKLNGAMDGAMKFVKGDAIASVIIALVNIVGGICIGVFLNSLTFADSVLTYTVLTVGDGMVSQIPSLFVSVAAGVVITRVAGADNAGMSLGHEIGRQLSSSPSALLMSGGMLGLFVLVPGFPKLQFFALAVALLGLGYTLARRLSQPKPFDRSVVTSMQRDGASLGQSELIVETMTSSAVPLKLRCSPDIREQLDPAALDEAVSEERRAIQTRTGIPFPGLRFVIDSTLPASTFAVDVHEMQAASGNWTELTQQAQAEPEGPGLPTALAKKIADIIRSRAGEFVGLQEVQTLMRALESDMPDLVAEVQKTVPMIRVTEVLRRLAEERVSLRHMREILESLLVWAVKERDNANLVEMVRVDIGRFVVHPYLDDDRSLWAFMINAELEALIRGGVQTVHGAETLSLSAEKMREIGRGIDSARTTRQAQGALVVLCSQGVRRHVGKLLNREGRHGAALSFQEVPTDTVVHIAGNIKALPQEERHAA